MGRKRKNIEQQEEGPKEEEKGKKPQVLEKVELSAQEREEHDRLDREYFDRLPPGYRFLPTGDELIIDYLRKKVSNLRLPKNRIRDANIYTLHPQQLTSMYKLHRGKEWYFFTPRSKKYPNGQRPDRSAGHGFWKATAADDDIKDDQGIIVGAKKTLVYYEGKAKDKNVPRKTDWMMHEYKLKGENTNNNVGPVTKKDEGDMTLDEWVLCKIYNKTTKPKEPNDIQQEDEPTPNQNPNAVGFVNAVSFPMQEVGQGPDGANFVNAVGFAMQEEQLPNPNPNTKQGPDGTSFVNAVGSSLMQNEQVPNPNNTKQFQDDVGFDGMAIFPMPHNEQASDPETKQEPVFLYLSNDDQLGYHESDLLPSLHYSIFPFYDHQAKDMYLIQSSSTYHIQTHDTLQRPTEVFDPPPLDYKDERLDCRDEHMDDAIPRPNQALSAKEKKRE